MFLISKIVGSLSDPFTLFYLAALLACLLLHVRRQAGPGRRILSLTLGLVFVPAVVPLEKWFTVMLEDRFVMPSPLPGHVDGIIVLGGAIDPVVSRARGQLVLNSAVSRLLAVVNLSRLYPDARVVFTGGSGSPLDQDDKEAPYAAEFYRQIGFDARRIVFEGQSRNTHENALLAKAVMNPKPGEVWLLVTSAFHMPRAVGCFRAEGWPVVAYPVDYHTTGRWHLGWSDLRFSPGAGLGGLAVTVHELLGLASYRVLGWTDSLLPAP